VPGTMRSAGTDPERDGEGDDDREHRPGHDGGAGPLARHRPVVVHAGCGLVRHQRPRPTASMTAARMFQVQS
jgi:hypothetical protein